MKYKVIKNSRGRWYFQILASNGKVLARSENTYTRKRNAVEAIGIIKAGAGFAKVVEAA